MHKLVNDPVTKEVRVVLRTQDSTWIPFDPDNIDYPQFKKNIASGVQLTDANNNVMTSEQANTFLATIP